jgi:hypothetical protein
MLNPLQVFKNISKKLNSRGLFFGVNALDEDYTIFNLRIVPLTFNLISFAFVISYNFKINSDDLEKFVFCFVTFCLLIKAALKMTSFLGFHKELKLLIKNCEKVYQTLEKYDTENILAKNTVYLGYITNTMFVLYSCAGITSILYPFVLKLIGKELMLPYGFQLPFIEPFSVVGFILNYLYSCLCCFNCVGGFSVSDMMFALTVFPFVGGYQMLIKMIKDLNTLDNVKDEEEMEKREELLHEIIQLHQTLLMFIEETEKFNRLSTLLNLGINIFQSVASLFALISIQWYIGITIVAINLFEAFLFCFFGAILEIIQDKFNDAVYEIKWVGKKPKECKTVLILLTATEKKTKLTYIFGPLNFETYASVRIFID